MNSNNKKCLKKTTYVQFKKLVDLIEEYPQLATGSPLFGSNKVAVEKTWDNVAQQINAYGPPIRSGQEWKKIWHDQKCRLKRKISDNNKSLHGTGGGPCIVNNLTEMELQIDKICHLSSAAAPSGKILGVPTAQNPLFPSVEPNCNILGISHAQKNYQLTPPRSHIQVAVVTPTTSKQTPVQVVQCELMSDIFTSNISDIITLDNSPPKTIAHLNEASKLPSKQATTSTPKQTQAKKKVQEENTRPFHQNRKRKHGETELDQQKLLCRQTNIQQTTADIMKKQLEAFIESTKVAKIQAEASKIQAEAQAIALKEIADSVKVMAQALVDIVKHLKDED